MSTTAAPVSSDLEINMRATAEGFVHSFDGRWAPGATMRYRAPECEHSMLPATLGLGTTKQNNQEWAAHFKRLDGLVTNAKVSLPNCLALVVQLRRVQEFDVSDVDAGTPRCVDHGPRLSSRAQRAPGGLSDFARCRHTRRTLPQRLRLVLHL